MAVLNAAAAILPDDGVMWLKLKKKPTTPKKIELSKENGVAVAKPNRARTHFAHIILLRLRLPLQPFCHKDPLRFMEELEKH